VAEKGKSGVEPGGKPSEGKRQLSPAAERAVAEAAVRRKAREAAPLPKESDGRTGPDPTRYGDLEVKGIASDF
jgi:hypothetical protein